MNEEIKYIPYGLDEISQLDLMTSLADGIEPYLNSKRWARKEKNRKAWLSAYLDIINLGLVGASNESGVWRVNHSGNIDMDSKSDLEKEMYGDAAYYIRQQMSKMTPRVKEEDKKEEKKDKYNFINDFKNHLLTKYYGNNEKLYLSPTEGWDSKDERDPKTGLRTSITNRKAALINALTSYRDLLEDKYDFEGSPFSGKDDVVRKIDEAIEALNSPDLKDDNEKLHALGLGYNQFFSNGGNDVYETGTDGNPVTYLQYYDNLNKITKLETEAKAIAAGIARANYWDGFKSYDFSKFHGRPLKSEESNIEYLSNLFAKDKWSGDEASLIVQAFKLAALNGKLVPLSKEEISKLNPSIWKNRAKYLRKIDGVDGLYYDTYSRLYKKFYKNGQTSQTSFLDILNLNNPDILKKLADEKYWNSPIKELDSYDYANVIGALADAVSIADPEPISAATIAEIGTVARSYGRSKNTGFWENSLYTAGDAVLGGLAAIPALGDAGLAWRMTGTGLKYLGYAGLIFNAKNLPEAGKAFSKWYNYATQDGFSPIEAYKKLTRKEALDLQNGLLELVGIKGAVSGAVARKITKPVTSNTQKVVDVDVKVNGKQTKLTVTPEEAKLLRTGITGKLEKTNNKLRSTKSALEYAKKNNIKVEDIEIVSAPGKIPFTRNSGMTPRTISTEGTAKPEDFGRIWRPFARWQSKFNSVDNNINSSENFWTKNFGGYRAKSNRETPKTTEIRSSIETPYKPLVENSPLKPQPKGESSELFNIQRPIKEPKSTPNYGKKDLEAVLKSLEEVNRFKLRYSSNGRGEAFDKSDGFNSNTIKEGKLDFDGITIKVSKSDLKGVDRKNANFSGKVSSIRNRIAKLVELYSKTHDVELTALVILKLKKNGWLKQGGQINLSSDNIIENFIKNYNI